MLISIAHWINFNKNKKLSELSDCFLFILNFFFFLSSSIACEFVHLALGSSAGTVHAENDTCVSARIKIFMTMIRIILNTKTMGPKILLETMMMTMITQKYVANCCTNLPLNFVAGSFSQWKIFSKLLCLFFHFTSIWCGRITVKLKFFFFLFFVTKMNKTLVKLCTRKKKRVQIKEMDSVSMYKRWSYVLLLNWSPKQFLISECFSSHLPQSHHT